MADYSMYHSLGQGEQLDPNDPTKTSQPAPPQFQPPVASQPYNQGLGYGAPAPPSQQQLYGSQPAHGYGPPPGQGYAQEQPPPPPPPPSGDAAATLAPQLADMTLGAEPHNTARRKKKDRHAFHTVEAPVGSPLAFNGGPPQPGVPVAGFPGADPVGPGGFASQQISPLMNQFPAPVNPPFSPANHASAAEFAARPGMAGGAPFEAVVPASGQHKVSPDEIPSVPVSRDAVQPYFLSNVYPTFDRHVPPPAAISFVAYDQGNSSPKFTRLTLNNIPSNSEALHSTGLPLGLLLQPLAPLQTGEQPIPVLDFGDTGPPRCRRCRAYMNPFMIFRSGGNKFVCNLCTYPNDTPPEYFCATSPQGIRVDRDQRPELCRGTVEFVVPKEYWTKEPVGLRWLFLIDVTQESFNKGFLEAFCEGILGALYGADENEEKDENGDVKRRIPPNARVGFVSFDKEVHFYNLSVRSSDLLAHSFLRFHQLTIRSPP